MIARYNRQQFLLGIWNVLLSAIGFGAAWLFFRYVPAWGAKQFGYSVSPVVSIMIAAVVLLLITWSGIRHAKRTGGFYGFAESSLNLRLDESMGSALMVENYVGRVTGPAYVLSQLFLAGPLCASRARKHFYNRVKIRLGLEQRLKEVLAELRRCNKWQTFRDHPQSQPEILLLAHMELIDFSTAKEEPRFKANVSHGMEL